MKCASVILVLFLSMFAVQGVYASEQFVCGQSIVETGVGTTREEVLEKCGPPSAKDSDRWYYRNQPGQVTIVLVFQIGTLEQIETLQE